jgi:hypothetical protein
VRNFFARPGGADYEDAELRPDPAVGSKGEILCTMPLDSDGAGDYVGLSPVAAAMDGSIPMRRGMTRRALAVMQRRRDLRTLIDIVG